MSDPFFENSISGIDPGWEAAVHSNNFNLGFCDDHALILYVYLENDESGADDSVLTVSGLLGHFPARWSRTAENDVVVLILLLISTTSHHTASEQRDV